ncbi:MAG: glycosyltransferase [Synergistaceae bacterium]|nr:glycosyltransferase [Synergistaceae bacterium]
MKISVIIPVYNEEECLAQLFERLFPVMVNLSLPFELIFVNDGSRDDSLNILLGFHGKHPDNVRIIDFNGNFGQHSAIMAGFEASTGDAVITIDADLQNPPEEIPRIVEQIQSGHDVVGTVRTKRHDPFFRKFASKIVNKITNKITGLRINDYGCMLRGYRKDIVDIMKKTEETSTFIPALAQKFAANPVEISVSHNERELGVSKYSLFRLIRLNFDLMTSFSLVPLQVVTMLGMLVSMMSFLFGIYMLVRRIFIGPEAEGVFLLLTLNFFLMGITMSCVGVAGEYIGRIYQEVRNRPRYIIKNKW